MLYDAGEACYWDFFLTTGKGGKSYYLSVVLLLTYDKIYYRLNAGFIVSNAYLVSFAGFWILGWLDLDVNSEDVLNYYGN